MVRPSSPEEERQAAKEAEAKAQQAATAEEYRKQLSEELHKIKPGWEPRVSTLCEQFPKRQQSTIVAVLTATEGHVGQAKNALKDFPVGGDEGESLAAALSKIELEKFRLV